MKFWSTQALSLVTSLGFATVTLMSTACGTTQETKKLTRTERARLFVQAANGALGEGDPTGALQNLVLAERDDASLPELHHTRAIAFYVKKDLDAALKSALKAVSLKPDYADANNTLGKIYLDRGNLSAAEKPLKAAAEDALNREAYKANTNLGILYYRLGQYEQSELHLSRAIADAPMNACIARYYRGHIRLKHGHLGDAIDDYGQATRRACAAFGDAHLALGIALERNKQFENARKKFIEINQNFPNTKVAEQAMQHLRYLP